MSPKFNSERVREIQAQTPWPDSTGVAQALFQVWNEVQQECDASLAAMQKELEEARAERDGSMDVARIAESKYEMEHADRDRLRIRAETAESTITAQAERIARLEEALGVAREAMDERRGYVNGGNPSACWQEMKYGEIWDQEDAQVSAALTPPTPCVCGSSELEPIHAATAPLLSIGGHHARRPQPPTRSAASQRKRLSLPRD